MKDSSGLANFQRFSNKIHYDKKVNGFMIIIQGTKHIIFREYPQYKDDSLSNKEIIDFANQ